MGRGERAFSILLRLGRHAPWLKVDFGAPKKRRAPLWTPCRRHWFLSLLLWLFGTLRILVGLLRVRRHRRNSGRARRRQF
jgi:hypothetical protein